LDTVLRDVPRVTNENVMVGYDTADDAGVYLLTEDCALVQTVDFFTPIVDDPFTYGAIAAANALSDVYAMGGRPISALSILAFPAKGDLDVLKRILSGGAEKMREARCAVVGGHSVNDDEIKFGYAVTGTIHPKRVWTNAEAQAGDVLVFTKRIGTGVVATALKRGIATMAHVDEAVESMLTLNARAAELLAPRDVHACTDITGFGLLGHVREMALASEMTFEIDSSAVPLLPGARDYAVQGALPGGLHNNRDFVSDCVEDGATVPPEIASLLYDPQTSGGLLVSLSPAAAAQFLADFPVAAQIGRVVPRSGKPIRVL
jgi:selenide,water dikinase